MLHNRNSNVYIIFGGGVLTFLRYVIKTSKRFIANFIKRVKILTTESETLLQQLHSYAKVCDWDSLRERFSSSSSFHSQIVSTTRLYNNKNFQFFALFPFFFKFIILLLQSKNFSMLIASLRERRYQKEISYFYWTKVEIKLFSCVCWNIFCKVSSGT